MKTLEEFIEVFNNQRIVIYGGDIFELDESDITTDDMGTEIMCVYLYEDIEHYINSDYIDKYNVPVENTTSDLEFISYMEGC